MSESGYQVKVIATRSALRFVGAATFAALSGAEVASDSFADVEHVAHVALGRRAELVVVVPATADLLARAVAGRADDLLTATLLTTRAPVLYLPAMHTEMWTHPATVANVALLRQRGALVIDPDAGRLTGADSGRGRLADPGEIARLAMSVHASNGRRDLAGRRVLVTAGGTREFLDPVRFLGNRSSGRQGWAVARAAVARGAEVTVVAAHVNLAAPPGAEVIPVGTAAELRETVLSLVPSVDVVVMAAAVADFRAAAPATDKIKKSDEPPVLRLVPTVDILAELGEVGDRRFFTVGFAAETSRAEERGRAKLAAKGADLLVVNQVADGVGFEVETNTVTILGADGGVHRCGPASKDVVAHAIWDQVLARFAAAPGLRRPPLE